jgi:hypothetical protein
MLVQMIILFMMQLSQSSKTDDNYSAMAKAAEDQNIIEKTALGNQSSINIFLWKIKTSALASSLWCQMQSNITS